MTSCDRHRARREGKVLVMLCITLPMLLAVIGLVLDGGRLTSMRRYSQHVADSAATAAATEILKGKSDAEATAVADAYIRLHADLANATVQVHIPPTSGYFAGSSQYVEIELTSQMETNLIHLAGISQQQTVTVHSVAGYEDSTAGAAIVVLDPNPSKISTPAIGTLLPALPSLIAGFETLGVGRATVDGAVHVNTQWGGIDQDRQPTGTGPAPPYALACTPLVSLSKLIAQDIRVVGGVDRLANYQVTSTSSGNELKAGCLAVPDPLKSLQVPTVGRDPDNVKASFYGNKVVTGPLLVPTVLNPGVYDSLTVAAGPVVFNPGVYIIRGGALTITAGPVTAEGVAFYITNNAAYDPATSNVDEGDGEDAPPAPSALTLTPSAVIDVGILGNSFTPLNDQGSPYYGMIVFQRRQDRRPIAIVQQNLLGTNRLEGMVYAKWGHVIFAGQGVYNAKIVSGTLRVVALSDLQLTPNQLLAPAQDVFLVQ